MGSSPPTEGHAMMRTAIYCRISSDRTGEGLGVARQQEDCEKLAADRGWEVADVYVDNDLSAYSGKARPNYARMLDAIKAGEIDAIVAWHPDRLHRSPRELESFVTLVEDHAVAIATVRAGDLDLSTASGRMTARIVGSVARHESEQKSERIRRALEQNAKNGKRHGGGRPFGFEADGVTIYEPEAAMIRDAAERVLAGESITAIARRWNEAGVRTPQRGATWAPTPTRSVLIAPRVAGLRAVKGEVVGEAVWEPILDRQTWERVTAQLARTTRAGRPARYLLSTIARCGVPIGDALCDAPLWGSRSTNRHRYMCSSGPGRAGCGRLAVAADQLDAFVREVVIAVLTEDDGEGLARARRRRAGDDRRQAQAAADLAAAEARQDELMRDHARGLMTRREWLVAREELQPLIDKATRTLGGGGGDVLAELPSKPEELAALWEARADDTAWTRAIIARLIERIVIHPASTRGPKLDRSRVEIAWR